MRSNTEVAIGAKTVKSVYQDALFHLASKRGATFANQIKPILEINLKRGRIATWVLASEAGIQGYVTNLVENYAALSDQVQKLQIDRDEALWKELFEHLTKWAYGYLLRKNFQPGQATLELAIGQATEASLQILSSHFPYDVGFDIWCHRLLINTCAKFLRDQGRKANRLAVIEQSVEELAEKIKSPESPEFRADQETLYERLTSAVKDLAPARAYVIHGYYVHEKDFATIAQELGKSVAAIHSLHFHALNDLKKRLASEESSNRKRKEEK